MGRADRLPARRLARPGRCHGAAAAVAGLVFAAVPINLAQILKLANLPRRAMETLAIAAGLRPAR